MREQPTGTAEPMKVDLRRVNAGAHPGPAKKPAPLVGREYAFTVRYADPEGGEHSATLVSRILDADRMTARDQWAAAAAGGPWEHLPPAAQSRIWAQVTVASQLKELPDWLARWLAVDDELLGAVYEEVEGHTARYFRGDGRASSEDQGAGRVQVVPSAAP